MSFQAKDCALITRMGGVPTAVNLRELRERVAVCPDESLFHHFCETALRPTFDDPEFRNDFAVWASRHLRDRVLSERLGILNPYAFTDLAELREVLLETLDLHLAEVGYLAHAPVGEDFRFMRAVTITFDTDIHLERPEDLGLRLPEFSHSSIYYHFIEARRRTENGKDDFSVWLADFGERTQALREALEGIDFYYLTLTDLKATLVNTVSAIPLGVES